MEHKIRNVQRAIAALVSSGVSATDGDVTFLLRTLAQAAYEDAARIAIKMQEDTPPFLALINGNDVAAKLRQRGKDVTG